MYSSNSEDYLFWYCSKFCYVKDNFKESFWKFATQKDINNYLKNVFQIKVKKHENGCWEWLGGKFPQGYGLITIKRTARKAHRISYMYHNNDWNISTKELVCHKCDWKICVAPDHLFKGSHLDNFNDMIKKNRDRNLPKGKDNTSTKINEEIAIKVIELLKNQIPSPQIANSLNISKCIVDSIKYKKAWKYL